MCLSIQKLKKLQSDIDVTWYMYEYALWRTSSILEHFTIRAILVFRPDPTDKCRLALQQTQRGETVSVRQWWQSAVYLCSSCSRVIVMTVFLLPITTRASL